MSTPFAATPVISHAATPVISHAATPVIALVPLRALGVGKSRLAGALSIDQRAALAAAMLADVAATLAASRIDRIVVAAGGSSAADAARALDLEVVADPPGTQGLDGALQAATDRLGPVGTLVVVAADLPRLRPSDVDALLAGDHAVVVAPTIDGGTGGLLRRPPDVITTAYGRGSADRHLDAARRAGVHADRRDLPGFAHDVDVADDLRALRRDHPHALGPHTAAVVAHLDVPAAG